MKILGLSFWFLPCFHNFTRDQSIIQTVRNVCREVHYFELCLSCISFGKTSSKEHPVWNFTLLMQQCSISQHRRDSAKWGKRDLGIGILFVIVLILTHQPYSINWSSFEKATTAVCQYSQFQFTSHQIRLLGTIQKIRNLTIQSPHLNIHYSFPPDVGGKVGSYQQAQISTSHHILA